jgi:methylglutamate dehydrogenase subunit D
MVERESPLGPAFRPGVHGGDGVTLSDLMPPFIAEAASWPGNKAKLAAAISDVTGLSLTAAPNAGASREGAGAFSIGPERFLVVGDEALGLSLPAAITANIGTVTDLSHGRTAIRIEGPRTEWVLSKLFAIDFSRAAFQVSEGRATVHHDIFAQIQRTGEDRFDIFVFRSFARSFWFMLCDAAEEVGYEVRT